MIYFPTAYRIATNLLETLANETAQEKEERHRQRALRHAEYDRELAAKAKLAEEQRAAAQQGRAAKLARRALQARRQQAADAKKTG